MRIGITGGIGAGKSYVSRLFAECFGIPVYDCDREAKRLMTTSSVIREQLVAVVGKDAYQSDGNLNKPLLAQFLFANEAHARQVNAIVHPVVKSDCMEWVASQEASGFSLVAIESAILFEAGMRSLVDKVMYVDAPKELRIQRAMQRDGATREQIEARISRQQSEKALGAACDFVVVNDGRDLMSQLRNIIDILTNEHINR